MLADIRPHLARNKPRLHAIQQLLQPLPLLDFGHEVAVGTRADQAHRWLSLDQKTLAVGDSLFQPTHGVFLDPRLSDLGVRVVVVRVGEQRERRSKNSATRTANDR